MTCCSLPQLVQIHTSWYNFLCIFSRAYNLTFFWQAISSHQHGSEIWVTCNWFHCLSNVHMGQLLFINVATLKASSMQFFHCFLCPPFTCVSSTHFHNLATIIIPLYHNMTIPLQPPILHIFWDCPGDSRHLSEIPTAPTSISLSCVLFTRHVLTS